MTKVITVEGMMCGMCEAHVAEALRKVPGVSNAKADRNKKQATVTCSEDVTPPTCGNRPNRKRRACSGLRRSKNCFPLTREVARRQPRRRER